jgi:membrane associated rhomboid family serine protease
MSFFQAQTSGSYYRPSLWGGFRFFPPVIKALLISNVAVWLFLDFFLAPFTIGGTRIGGANGVLTYYLALWPLGTHFLPWQLFTYMFIHGGFAHLFFNMLALWMFGMELENTWGSRKFLTYYLICGLGAGLANMLVAPLIGQVVPTVGASGAVFGVLVAFGLLFPERPIYIYFLLPVRAKYFVAVYMAIELFYGVTGTTDGVAHFAHLGGAAVGLVYVLLDRSGIPFGSWLRGAPVGGTNIFRGYGRFTRKPEEVHEAKFYDIKTGQPRGGSGPSTQEEIDAILDKISAGGYQSLTEEEKRILFEASKKLN